MKKTILIITTNFFIILSMFTFGISIGSFWYQKDVTPILINTFNLPLNTVAFNEQTISNTNLVQINEYDPSIVIDLKYASSDNFLNQQIYPFENALIQKDTMKKLKNANSEFKQYGYRIKIWDAYRPSSIQNILWEKIKDTRFIASPYKNGSRHNRGAAVDITLVDKSGTEIEMPTKFDEFTESAYRNSTSSSQISQKNAKFLCDIMIKHGFTPIDTEWWHFDDSNADTYPLLDISFEDLL